MLLKTGASQDFWANFYCLQKKLHLYMQGYLIRTNEYKKEQQTLTLEIKSYSTDKKVELDVAREVLEITKTVKNIFVSSKLVEKQQLLGFFCSNLILDSGKLDLELREPFKTIRGSADPHIWWKTCDALRTFRWNSLKERLTFFYHKPNPSIADITE